MNVRLLAYLRKLGLGADATDEQAWEFYRSLSGVNASIANALNYREGDEAARTTCDLMIRAAGYNPEDPTALLPAEPARTQTATSGGNAGGEGGPANDEIERARLEGERRAMVRLQEIRSLGEMAGCSDEFIRGLEADITVPLEQARQRIQENWRDRTRAREVAPDLPNSGPAQHSRNSLTDYSVDAMRCAMLMRAGVDDPAEVRQWFNRHGRLEQVQQGDALQRARDRGYEIMEMGSRVFIQQALALDGIRCQPTVSSIMEAFQSRGAAAMSTTSLVNIFTQTFGARLLQSYNEAVDTTEWVGVEENPNYLPAQRVRVGLTESLAPVPRGAEAEDITVGDETDYTKVARYGRKAIFDEMDIVNDNFGVITGEIPSLMGSASRRLRPDLVYAILLANPTMPDGVALFHATHNNLFAGAFGETNLEGSFAAMAVQRIGGVTVNLTPRWVIHPVAIDFTVDKLLDPRTTLVVAGTTDLVRPNGYAIGRKGLRHVGEARLDNGVVDPKTGTSYAGDVNDWYLAAEGPAPIVVVYLQGNRRAPKFRSGVLDQGQFGIWFDCQMSIGAKAVEWRSISKRTA